MRQDTADRVTARQPTGASRTFDWNYALRAVMASALVGAAAGMVGGLIGSGFLLIIGIAVPSMILGIPLLILLMGVAGLLVGTAVGLPVGLLLGLIGHRITQVRTGQWLVGVTTFVAAVLATPLLLWVATVGRGPFSRTSDDPPFLMAALIAVIPALLLAWVMSRKVPTILQRQSGPGSSATPGKAPEAAS
ncbi:hypothetical protein ACQBAT_14760 [Ornithinimicrobium sp. Y1847]|uniref:hypothetical protein n=1 Tax=Ornithinimicrobium sp. Y1847 TaxID=3405419 RepID=UPI003B679337